MIQFLKLSSFVINDVLSTAWPILRRHYFSILGLFFLLFLVFNASGLLSSFFSDYLSSLNRLLGFVVAFLFILIYFGLQLTLLKYLLHVIDHDLASEHVLRTIPTLKEIIYFFTAFFAIMLLCMVASVLTVMLAFPFVFFLVKVLAMGKDTAFNIAYGFGLIIPLFLLIRISFYPFFILDKQKGPFESIRLSLAITRGNFSKLLLLLAFFAILHLLSVYFTYLELTGLATGLSFVNSFLVVPFTSVVVAVAYRRMVLSYTGDEDPEFVKNII